MIAREMKLWQIMVYYNSPNYRVLPEKKSIDINVSLGATCNMTQLHYYTYHHTSQAGVGQQECHLHHHSDRTIPGDSLVCIFLEALPEMLVH